MNKYKLSLINGIRRFVTEIEFELMNNSPDYDRIAEMKGNIDDAFTEITDRELDTDANSNG